MCSGQLPCILVRVCITSLMALQTPPPGPKHVLWATKLFVGVSGCMDEHLSLSGLVIDQRLV